MESGLVLTGRGADSSASLSASWCVKPRPILPLSPKGTWFDDAMDLRNPEGDALVDQVLAMVAATEKRDRRRSGLAEVKHRVLVRKVLANGLRCHYSRRPALVAYTRKADGHRGGLSWISGEPMGRTVDLLVGAGLLIEIRGHWGMRSSTYGATEKLCEAAQQHGVTTGSLTVRLPFDRLVRLREGNAKTDLLECPSTTETSRWQLFLGAYNNFVARQDISLALTPDEAAEWVGHWNKHHQGEGVRLHRPELIQTSLYRQLNNGSFLEGGRLYGGWWINTPATLRRKIRINGEPTVELDFSGCAIRMLYHERGVDYRDDPYRLDPIAAYEAEQGLKPGHFREGVKAITQALINDCHGKAPEMIPLENGLSFRPQFKRAEVRRMIEEKHAPIADAFRTGVGLRLQRADSDIALSIIVEAKREQVVVLPVHDSFIVPQRKRDVLMNLMEEIYKDRYGFSPIIHST